MVKNILNFKQSVKIIEGSLFKVYKLIKRTLWNYLCKIKQVTGKIEEVCLN